MAARYVGSIATTCGTLPDTQGAYGLMIKPSLSCRSRFWLPGHMFLTTDAHESQITVKHLPQTNISGLVALCCPGRVSHILADDVIKADNHLALDGPFSFFISRTFGCELDSSIMSCSLFSCSIYSYGRKSFSGGAAANAAPARAVFGGEIGQFISKSFHIFFPPMVTFALGKNS